MPDKPWNLLTGDCLEVLRRMPENSIDAVVTDPPYGIGFMSKEWDNFRRSRNPADAGRDSVHGRLSRTAPASGAEAHRSQFQEWCTTWAVELRRVVKPGAHVLVFGGTRTFHRMACALEDAGLEIRDTVAWMYGQGFPKSVWLDKENGVGTALKPAWEPVIVAREPVKGTAKANFAEHGTGGLNIDDCRIEMPSGDSKPEFDLLHHESGARIGVPLQSGKRSGRTGRHSTEGRWPANVTLDEEAGVMLDERTGDRKGGGAVTGNDPSEVFTDRTYGKPSKRQPNPGYGDSGGASRFFYCSKASRKERDYGCEDLPDYTPSDLTGGRKAGSAGINNPRAGAGRTSGGKNLHPTVKPVDLMRWLVRLVVPKGGHVLDPFAGSGSTGVASVLEGRRFTGIEKDFDYSMVACARLAQAEVDKDG